MLDINRHKFYLVQILKDVYSDLELANYLGFKGGTALMFFYDLPRFSIDLDFNLLSADKEELVYEKVRKIILKYGTIFDEAKKYFGPLIVLDYGVGERKLKVEISKRFFEDRYEMKNLLGFNVMVMTISDMFAHKLCALTDRCTVTHRDIFDTWFFMQRNTPLNKRIVEHRMKVELAVHLENCINLLESLSSNRLLDGLGELMNAEMKRFVRNKLLAETITLLRFYREFPIL
ncbi:MAG: nucleotidyl transferase AbiEii/AbiGii toxin family protein, partial [Bacteroidales bacterium]|nr:nucleotidyl transferase AbiEii/AbiGii toxin family protein [Bacteroidales bacterium]